MTAYDEDAVNAAALALVAKVIQMRALPDAAQRIEIDEVVRQMQTEPEVVTVALVQCTMLVTALVQVTAENYGADADEALGLVLSAMGDTLES